MYEAAAALYPPESVENNNLQAIDLLFLLSVHQVSTFTSWEYEYSYAGLCVWCANLAMEIYHVEKRENI